MIRKENMSDQNKDRLIDFGINTYFGGDFLFAIHKLPDDLKAIALSSI